MQLVNYVGNIVTTNIDMYKETVQKLYLALTFEEAAKPQFLKLDYK